MKIFLSDRFETISATVRDMAATKGWEIKSNDSSEADTEILLKEIDFSIAILDSHSCCEEFTLLTRLKMSNPDLIVILVSDDWHLKNTRLAMNKGAFDVLLSTIDSRSLSATLQRAEKKIRNKTHFKETRQQLKRIEMELDIATQIQMNILPSTEDRIKGCDIAAAMIPAREIGGDFYDYFEIDDDRIGIVIGDVSGKGIPAALFMAVCRSLLKATALQGYVPYECLNHVNKVLSQDNPSAMFVTVFYGVFHKSQNRLEYSLAGHDSPLLLKVQGEVTTLERTSNMVLGFDPEVRFSGKSIILEKGDKLFLYTDGITEAENPARKLFGRDQLIRSLDKLKHEPTPKIRDGVLRDVKLFTLGTRQSDDLTALAFGI